MNIHISSRRAFLGTAAVAVAASVPAPAAASICKAAPYIPDFAATDEQDPLIDLLAQYRHGLAEFEARARGADEEWEHLTEETYGPLFDELRLTPPRPTTFVGAYAGIEFVLEELFNHLDSDANEAVLRVCAAFLIEQAGRVS